MNLEQLQQRIAKWENLHTEFKEWPVHADKLRPSDSLAASLVARSRAGPGQKDAQENYPEEQIVGETHIRVCECVPLLRPEDSKPVGQGRAIRSGDVQMLGS